MSDSLQPHVLQHPRLPCPSPSPRACSKSCPLSWWCHPTILSSVIPFSSCLQSSPASGSFLMSWFFASGGQSIRASASVLPINIQDWFPLGFDWRCLEETKTGYLPCFCCYFHLRPNKGLVVNSSTGAHLSLASGNAKRRLADCKCPTWSPSISHCNVSWILALAGRFFTADIIYYYIKYELLRVIRVGECSC